MSFPMTHGVQLRPTSTGRSTRPTSSANEMRSGPSSSGCRWRLGSAATTRSTSTPSVACSQSSSTPRPRCWRRVSPRQHRPQLRRCLRDGEDPAVWKCQRRIPQPDVRGGRLPAAVAPGLDRQPATRTELPLSRQDRVLQLDRVPLCGPPRSVSAVGRGAVARNGRRGAERVRRPADSMVAGNPDPEPRDLDGSRKLGDDDAPRGRLHESGHRGSAAADVSGSPEDPARSQS